MPFRYPAILFLTLALAGMSCSASRLEFSGDICEIAVRDVRRSREIKRLRDRSLIADVIAVLSAEREELSPARYGHTLPAGRFNLLFFACDGPVDQLAIGINFLTDYHAGRAYALSVEEKTKLRRLLGLRF